MSAFSAIVIAELEFSNIERHIFAAHFMERTDHAALENRPETFDSLSVNCADDILTACMVNDAMRIFAVKPIVTGRLIGAKQTDLVGDGFANKCGESVRIDIRDNTSDDIAFAADSADDRGFAGTDTASATPAAALIPMSVFRQPADESFINLDNAAELVDIFHECNADAMTHIPSGLQRTKAHIAPNLASAYSFFAGEHQMNDAIPIAERFIRVLENRTSEMRETIRASLAAIRALPMPSTGFKIVNPFTPATRAADAFRPALANKVSTTSVFVGEYRLELRDAHLMDLRRLFCSGHDGLLIDGKTVA